MMKKTPIDEDERNAELWVSLYERAYTLRQTQFRSERLISKYDIARSSEMSEMYDYALDAMRLSLVHRVYGSTITLPHVSWPATWWDAVKMRFFPQWLLRKFPARMAVWEPTADVLYPYLEGRVPVTLGLPYITVREAAPQCITMTKETV